MYQGLVGNAGRDTCHSLNNSCVIGMVVIMVTVNSQNTSSSEKSPAMRLSSMREDMTTLKDQGTAIVDKACGLQSSEVLSDGVGAHEV